MKKIAVILASLILSMTLFTASQAAVSIPDYLKPKNVGLQDLNKAITQKVNDAGDNQQEAAVSSINIVLQYVANLLLFIAAPLAVLFIVRAGGDYAFAMGEESKIESAKRELTWALLGLALVMFSYLIVRLLIQPFPLIQEGNNKQFSEQQAVAAEQKRLKTI